MEKRTPITVWLSFGLMIGTMLVATWRTVAAYQRLQQSAAGNAAVEYAALVVVLTLAAIWLVVAVPSAGTLFGVRFCRTILAVVMALGLLLVLVFRPPHGWDVPSLILTALQTLGAILLYVGPSRQFFRREDFAEP